MSIRIARGLRSRVAMVVALAVAMPALIVAGTGSANALEPTPTPIGAPGPAPTAQATTPPDGGQRSTSEPTDHMPPPTPGTDPNSSPTVDPSADPPPDPTSDPRPTHHPKQSDEPDPTSHPTSNPPSEAGPTSSPTGAARKPTIVTLDFDGNTVDQYPVSNLLQSLGIRAVFYVNSGRLDVGGDYMTTAQVRSLQARGHEIGGNTVSHVRLSALDAVEQRRQICADRFRLLSAGLTPSTFAYPYGDFGGGAPAAVQQCGYNNARTFGGLSCRGCAAAETVPPASLYNTRSVSGIDRDTTAGQLMIAVQRAQATGGWLQIAFQRFCSASTCASRGIAVHEFETFARWLDGQRRQGALAISTVHDVLGGGLRPGVVAPAASATRLQIANSSFENGGAPDAPQCFSITTSGDGNVFAARRVADRHSGGWAQEVVITKVAGTIKLQSAQDLGSCAPPILRQHKYRVAVWYKSSGPIALAAYTRRPTGGYSSFGTSATFRASGRWTQAVWTTKGAPATSNLALSVGVVFRSPGTYVLDDFSIADAGLAPKAEAPVAVVETDSRESGGGSEDLFVPSDTAPTIPAGPAAALLKASQRHGWLLTLEILGALVLMWGLFAALDRRFRQIHRRTRTRGPAHR